MKLILITLALAVSLGFVGCGDAGTLNAVRAPNTESPTPAATPFVPNFVLRYKAHTETIIKIEKAK